MKIQSEYLKQSQTTAWVLNLSGCLSGLWIFLSPAKLSALIAVALPLISIAVAFYFSKITGLTERDLERNPTYVPAVLAPAFGMSIHALSHYQLLEYRVLMVVVISSALFIAGVLLVLSGKLSSIFETVRGFFLFTFLSLWYTFGAYVTINCEFDNSQPTCYESKVLKKYLSAGRTTSRSVLLTPRGPFTDPVAISLDHQQFERIEVNQRVHVCIRNGALKTRWFYMED